MRRALFLLALVACSKGQPAQLVEASAPVVIVAPVDAAPSQISTSFVHFANDQLFECVDMTLIGTADAGRSDPFATAEKAMKGAKRIDQSCAEAFGDRPVLATCTAGTDVDGGGTAKFVASYYDYADVGMTDRYASQCLNMKGKWNAVSRDSTEWRKAKLDYDQKKLRGIADKLGNMPAPPSE